MKLFAQRDAEEFLKTGVKEFRYNRDIRLTPGAKDVFSEAGVKLVFDAGAQAPSVAAVAPASAGLPRPVASRKTSATLVGGFGCANIVMEMEATFPAGSHRTVLFARRPVSARGSSNPR